MKPVQLELFPVRDSVQQVIQELTAQLPITEVNQLMTALHLYGNTLVKQWEIINE